MSIYKLARRWLPSPIVRWLGNRNKVKRFTTDRLLFRFTTHPNEELIHERRNAAEHVPHASLEEHAHIPKVAATSMRAWYDVVQTEMVKRAGHVWIDPTSAWPMGPRGELYVSLFPVGTSPYLATPPLMSRFRRSPVKRIERAIILRDANEMGYSHFYNDLMTRLQLMRDIGIDTRPYTLVLNKALTRYDYARQLLEHSPLFEQVASIYLQEDEFVYCEEALFASIMANPTESPSFMRVMEQARAAAPPPEPYGSRRIFIIRGKQERRRLRNQDEIFEAVLKPLGFEQVDPRHLSLAEQIEAYAHCRHMVALQGAGMSNMIFRKGHPMSFFSISPMERPSEPFNPIYHNFALALGYDYGMVMTDGYDHASQSFELSVEAFEAAFRPFWAEFGEQEKMAG